MEGHILAEKKIVREIHRQELELQVVVLVKKRTALSAD